MPYSAVLKKVVRCPECSHSNAYYRMKRGTFRCRSCGAVFAVLPDGSTCLQTTFIEEMSNAVANDAVGTSG